MNLDFVMTCRQKYKKDLWIQDIWHLKITAFLINLLQNVVSNLLYIIEGQVEPGDVLRALHKVQCQLVQAVGIDQVVVRESDDVTVVPKLIKY